MTCRGFAIIHLRPSPSIARPILQQWPELPRKRCLLKARLLLDAARKLSRANPGHAGGVLSRPRDDGSGFAAAAGRAWKWRLHWCRRPAAEWDDRRAKSKARFVLTLRRPDERAELG